MSEPTKCPERVFPAGSFRGRICGRTAAYEHEGEMYCKTHHPPTVQAKREARHKEWSGRIEAENARSRLNEKLLNEARAIHDATGLTPRQMQERYEQMREALCGMLDCFDDGVGQEWNAKQLDAARSALANTERKTA